MSHTQQATALPMPLFLGSQCTAIDQLAAEQLGVSGFELMGRAAEAATQTLLQRWPAAKRVWVFCGKGNNAGDGYLLACQLQQLGLQVRVVQVGDSPSPLHSSLHSRGGDAATAFAALQAAQIEQIQLSVQAEAPLGAETAPDLVVDALLGTGAKGELRVEFARAVKLINELAAPVLCLDIPTGVDPESGHIASQAVQASHTLSFVVNKFCLFTGAGVSVVGDHGLADLGFTAGMLQTGPVPVAYRYAFNAQQIAPLDLNTYKHRQGHVVIVGGDLGYGGAVLMAAEAAMRSGAGMVSIISHQQHRAGVLARVPEVMFLGVGDAGVGGDSQLVQRCEALLAKSTCVVHGPGLGRGEFGRSLDALVWRRNWLKIQSPAVDAPIQPMLVDADGLYWLAQRIANGENITGPRVLTPHLAEAAALLRAKKIGAEKTAIDTAELVQANRLEAALALSSAEQICVLKGAGTLIASDAGPVALCRHGNPGMATAGMGDVLAGVIGALLAQGMPTVDAARVGTCLHSLAADLAAKRLGQPSLIATDVIAQIPAALS